MLFLSSGVFMGGIGPWPFDQTKSIITMIGEVKYGVASFVTSSMERRGIRLLWYPQYVTVLNHSSPDLPTGSFSWTTPGTQHLTHPTPRVQIYKNTCQNTKKCQNSFPTHRNPPKTSLDMRVHPSRGRLGPSAPFNSFQNFVEWIYCFLSIPKHLIDRYEIA